MPNVSEVRSVGDLMVSAVGMGSMTLTQTPEHDPHRAIDVVAAAIDAGITFFDTADSYGHSSVMGMNETVLIDALRAIPGALDRVVFATKGGHTRHQNATWWIDGTPRHIAAAARDSLQRSGLDSLPLYQHHRPDPRTPYADSMGAFRQLVDEGLVQRVGVSNVSVAQLEIAVAELGTALVSVQNEFSPAQRSEQDVLSRCEDLGLAFLAWGPLGGMREAKQLTAGLGAFAEVAAAHGVSPQRVSIAWLLARSPNLIPIPGASRAESIRDSAAAIQLVLNADELARLDQAA